MWTNIKIHKTQIKHETERATLIKLPSTSNLKGWCFWHPSKLVREDGLMFNLSFNEDWKFKLVRENRNNPDTKRIGHQEMLDAFDKQIEEDNNESYIIVEEPKKIESIVEVDESLKR